ARCGRRRRWWRRPRPASRPPPVPGRAPRPRRRRDARACRSLVVAAHPAELLLDDRVVELLEERLRLAQRLARAEVARLPAADPGRVVAGEDLVRVALLLDLAELDGASDHPFVAEQLVHLL